MEIEHINKQMGLRLDKYIDLDIDNDFVKYLQIII